MANNNPTIRLKENNWTEVEITQLKKLYPKKDNEIVAQKLGRSVPSIRAKANLLKLKKGNRYWDQAEEKFVVKNWKVMSVEELIVELNRKFKIEKTKWAVINKYRELTGKPNY